MKKKITILTVIALFSITLFSGCAMTTLKGGSFDKSIKAAEKAEGLKEEAIVEKAVGLEKKAIEAAIVEKETLTVRAITVPVDEPSRMLKDEGRSILTSFDFDKFSKGINAKSTLFKISMLALFGIIISFGFIIYKTKESKMRKMLHQR